MVTRTLIGTLLLIPAGRPDGSDAFYMSTGNEEYTEVIFTSSEQASNTPINTKIALSVVRDADDIYTVADAPRYYETVSV